MRFELQQTVYTYWLNNKSSEHWTGTSVMQYKDIKKDTLDNLRAYDERRKHMWAQIVPNAGWHFTNISSDPVAFTRKKMQSYAHQEYGTPEWLEQVAARVANNEDYLGRPFQLGVDETGLPKYLLDNRKEYAHLMKPNHGNN